MVPPLRERPEDIAPLAEYFLERFMQEVPEFVGKRLSSAAIELLEQYAFPGNVRELKNIIERAVYRDTTQELTPEDIDLPLPTRPELEQGSFKMRIELLEKELIRDALERASGNQARAARLLGLSYHQFRYFYAKHAAKPARPGDAG